MHRLALAAGLFTAVVVAGCGDYPRSRVHGTITYQGKPLTHAVVTFMTRDNQAYRADLSQDGRYEVAGVVRGPVKVAVQQIQPSVRPRPDPDLKRKGGQVGEAKDAPAALAARDPAPSESVPTGPPLPGKYADPNTSGLVFELKDPDQAWSVDLK